MHDIQQLLTFQQTLITLITRMIILIGINPNHRISSINNPNEIWKLKISEIK